jgi:hypothetical protein
LKRHDVKTISRLVSILKKKEKVFRQITRNLISVRNAKENSQYLLVLSAKKSISAKYCIW